MIDRAIQVHGGMGVSQDTLAEAYTYARFIRIGDGPDQCICRTRTYAAEAVPHRQRGSVDRNEAKPWRNRDPED